jgi:hypothetical protein
MKTQAIVDLLHIIMNHYYKNECIRCLDLMYEYY